MGVARALDALEAYSEAVRVDEAAEQFVTETADTHVPTKELPDAPSPSSQSPKCSLVGIVELGDETRVAITVTAAAAGMNTIAMTLPEAKMIHKSLGEWINFVEMHSKA